MTSSKPPSPPVLEQLGALGSLLIHDMANQLCIVSGNATFAQMALSDSQHVARAVAAITKATEQMSHVLSQCADLRRRMTESLPPGEGAEALVGVKELFRERAGWTLEAQGGLEGPLSVPTTWVVFAVAQALTELPCPSGQARVRRIRPEEDTTFLPGGNYWECRLAWESEEAFSFEEIRKLYRNFGLLAAFELVRQSGGKLEAFTPAPGHHELFLCVPYESDLKQQTEPEE